MKAASFMRATTPLAAALMALLGGCSTRGPAQSREGAAPPARGDGIAVAAPADVGLRPNALAALRATAAADKRKDLESILVARKGRLVFEAYFNGGNVETLRDVRSAAKTITGTLVGIALHDGTIKTLDAPVVGFFPAAAASWPSNKRSLTIRHLLEMRSGLDADDWWEDPKSPGAEVRMDAAPDRLVFGLNVPLAAAPGERWLYASVNTMLLGRIVSLATGKDLETYAKEKLFTPLGIGPFKWHRDAQGQIIPQGNLAIRSRDLLKFGLLFQQRGVWQGKQLVPAVWIDEATQPRTVFPADPGTGLGERYKGYGHHWWTGEAGTQRFYFASGNGGQRVFVVPGLELVVVTTSAAYGRGYAHRRAHEVLTAVLAAID